LFRLNRRSDIGDKMKHREVLNTPPKYFGHEKQTMNATQQKNQISDHIFRAYDIRGIYEKDLTTQIAEQIAMGFGTYLGGVGRNLAVGRDVRLSGEELKNAVVKGLGSVGCNVMDLGLVTTPILYWTIAHLNRHGGVMVTASHNPPEWNGFKLCMEKGYIVGQGFGMEELKEIVQRKRFVKSASAGKTETYGKIIDDYSKFILDKIRLGRRLRVVLDTGNGAAGIIAPKLFRQLGCQVTALNEELDGRFPSHSPEPTPEALQQLRAEVKKTGADLGVGYDGDGDRSVFVDDEGRILTGDIVSIIFAKTLIQKAGTKVVYDVSCSLAVEESVRASGGVPVVEKVGRPFMMERVLRENAVFGGERSGHFYFSEIYGIDDGTYASLKMAEIISASDKGLSKMVDAVPKYFSSTLNMACPDEHKFKVTAKTREFFRKMGYQILQIDGVKAYDHEGWVLIRPSNTEPLIRVFVEGKTRRKHGLLLGLARKVLKKEIEKAA